jgi:hypothetical protein
MYVLVNELMKEVHMHVEYPRHNLLLLLMANNDISMAIINIIP